MSATQASSRTCTTRARCQITWQRRTRLTRLYGRLCRNLQRVGVVTYKLNALKTAPASGEIRQNVNFALKASAAASFPESNRVAFENGSATTAMGHADLADHAKAISAFIACN
jgi:hypothetical protein